MDGPVIFILCIYMYILILEIHTKQKLGPQYLVYFQGFMLQKALSLFNWI